MRRILGVDPGLSSTGAGVIEVNAQGGFRLLWHGKVLTRPSQPLPERLKLIHDLIAGAIERHRPDTLAIESIFFAKNVRSAVLMAHGRGAALLAAAQCAIPVVEFAPREIKLAITGSGRAGKEQVERLVMVLLGLRDAPGSDHESDALAAALCEALRGAEKKAPPPIGAEEPDGRKVLLGLRRGKRRGKR